MSHSQRPQVFVRFIFSFDCAPSKKTDKHQFTIQKIFEIPKKNQNSDVIELEDRTETLGTIYISLFDNEVPNTAQIFCDLATGVHGYGYLNSNFHRIIPKCVIQGGIVTIEDEIAGELIYTSTIQGKQLPIKLTYPTFKFLKTKTLYCHTISLVCYRWSAPVETLVPPSFTSPQVLCRGWMEAR